MRISLTALLLAPAVALAGSTAFDGTWKMRLDSLKVSGKPDSYLLADGTFTCSSCDPALKVAADGAAHAVTGHAYYDSASVKVVNPNTIEITYYRGGKVSGKVTDTVSADGKSYTGKFVNYDGTKEMNATFTEKRVSAGPAGAHTISGDWQQDAVPAANDAATIVSYEMGADHFRMSANGQSYDAKFDGKEYPIAGDPGHTTVTLKRLSANAVEETDRRQGKVRDVIHLATAADGKTLTVEDKDVAHGQTTTFTLEKQK
ncbi:MAG TPA: hypothetical protein VH135_01870 [Steroidobacteraceae bacterium]|nr:hypothetical protein [Steroidobacteraceae bacterium]